MAATTASHMRLLLLLAFAVRHVLADYFLAVEQRSLKESSTTQQPLPASLHEEQPDSDKDYADLSLSEFDVDYPDDLATEHVASDYDVEVQVTQRTNNTLTLFWWNPTTETDIHLADLAPNRSHRVLTLTDQFFRLRNGTSRNDVVVAEFQTNEEKQQLHVVTYDGVVKQIPNQGKVKVVVANELREMAKVYWKNPENGSDVLLARLFPGMEVSMDSYCYHTILLRRAVTNATTRIDLGEDARQKYVVSDRHMEL
eukprot:TRINITY_DN94509_c0_g1_i1.p1 TRINITY_DN94509_c0_g1~~TRINITY_DN94509_c0_g1_i1.p1  ORF type:complete len:270 (-),score=26.39 TRINITY_DN94509_c0_g1_i1:328-1092(-)